MKLFSDDFKEGGTIDARFTCDGANVSPHLAWEDAPPGTKSFALVMDDPDAPMGTWVHWLLCNIPPDTREISRDSVPEGAVKVAGSSGRKGYGGPCPPSGVHRYFFKLYALDIKELKPGDKEDFYREVEKHKLAEAVLMGRYGR